MQTLSGSYLTLANQLPIESGDILFIASDIKQIALDCRANGERFDVNAFIESFQAQLGEEGTLVVPAYTDYLKSGEIFDHAKGKPSTGALSNKVMRRKDFGRSHDPLHSVFVWGKHADAIQNLNTTSSLGKGSIFDFLYQNKAKMICIDVDFQNSLTFVHYVEEKENVSYRKPYKWNMKRLIDDQQDEIQFTFHTKKPWILTELYGLQSDSEKDGVNQLFAFNQSTIQYFELEKMHDYILDYMKSGKKLYTVSLKHFAKSVAKKVLGKK